MTSRTPFDAVVRERRVLSEHLVRLVLQVPDDFASSGVPDEWLALTASSEVARARALPLEGPDGRGARGFVGIVLIPHSTDAHPMKHNTTRVIRHMRGR